MLPSVTAGRASPAVTGGADYFHPQMRAVGAPQTSRARRVCLGGTQAGEKNTMTRPLLFPPITSEHAAAIGYVAAHWSLIEEFLATLMYQLIGLHRIPGQVITAEASFIQRIATITALINLTGNAKWIEDWQDIAKVLDGLRTRRNELFIRPGLLSVPNIAARA
jgi:hypothetical protein